MSDLEHCYNKGCGKQYKPAENRATACTFHPGEPYFHDAYKEWTCCKKRSTDFTEFLNYKGCTTSFHSNVKPVVAPRPRAVDEAEAAAKGPPRPPAPLVRPDGSGPLVPLPVMVTESLKKALAEQRGKVKMDGEGDTNDNGPVKVGTPCRHRGCSATYASPASDHAPCTYHPGLPVFHEGMKYWSCCQRKTSEFDIFMKQAGCEQGNHQWRASAAEKTAVPACRTDWHQTPADVYVTFYAKHAVPEECTMEGNAVRLKVKLVFEGGRSVLEREMLLGGIIDVERSEVTLAGPKVEVKMKKAEAAAWKTLELKE